MRPTNLLPERGLIIRKQWLDLIYAGKKPWEMRSTATSIRGRIALIEAGTGLITGETILVDCREPLDKESAKKFMHMHCVEDLSLLEKWRFPWVLAQTKHYNKPIAYQHPAGAVIWVKLKCQ